MPYYVCRRVDLNNTVSFRWFTIEAADYQHDAIEYVKQMYGDVVIRLTVQVCLADASDGEGCEIEVVSRTEWAANFTQPLG